MRAAIFLSEASFNVYFTIVLNNATSITLAIPDFSPPLPFHGQWVHKLPKSILKTLFSIIIAIRCKPFISFLMDTKGTDAPRSLNFFFFSCFQSVQPATDMASIRHHHASVTWYRRCWFLSSRLFGSLLCCFTDFLLPLFITLNEKYFILFIATYGRLLNYAHLKFICGNRHSTVWALENRAFGEG